MNIYLKQYSKLDIIRFLLGEAITQIIGYYHIKINQEVNQLRKSQIKSSFTIKEFLKDPQIKLLKIIVS